MNPTLATLLATLLPLSVPAAAPPPVTRVVLYPDRALLTRALDAPCSEQPTTVVFRGLPAALDAATLQATAHGPGARIDGVGVVPQHAPEAHLAQLQELDQKLEVLEQRRAEEHQARERAATARTQAEALRATIPGVLVRELLVERRPNAAAWGAGLDVVRAALQDALARERAVGVRLRALEREATDLRERREALALRDGRRSTDAEVVVRCTGKGTARVELSHPTAGARWAPVYEARTTEGGDGLELRVLAEVEQATGEAWKGVALTLSTATSRRDVRPPELQPLRLGSLPQAAAPKVLVRREEEVRHAEGKSEAVARRPGVPEPPPGVQAAEQGLSVRLEVPGRVDLPGDGRPTRLVVETLRLAATASLVSVPKLGPWAYRQVEAVNQARYPLLPGRVDLFSGGSYLGTTRLPAVAQRDAVRLSFGVDESVKVRRVTLEEDRRDPGFLGNTRRFLYGYRVELANFAARPVELRVQEHVPVSELDDVKVTLDERTTPGYEARDGILTWKVALAAKEQRSVELRFAVAVPDKYDSGGL